MVEVEKRMPESRGLGIWFLLPLVAGMITVFVFALQWRETIPVSRITVSGTRILSTSDVLALAAVSPDELLYKCNLFDVNKKIETYSYIRDSQINRELSGTLRIAIDERQPFASLSGSAVRYIDAHGVVLPIRMTGTRFDLPIVSGIAGSDTVHDGQTLSSDDATLALSILQASAEAGFSRYVSEINMNAANEVTLYSSEGGIPILLGREEVAKKITMLDTFWSNFMKPEMYGEMQYIDARYDGQIVVKWRTQTQAQKISS